MPLHPQVEALLAQLQQLGLPPLGSLPPEQARAVFDQAFLPPPEAIRPLARVENRRIPGPGGEIPIRIYAPTSGQPLPAMLHYHGGGWVIMNLDTHEAICRNVALAAGCMVVSVDYRLAPESRFPAAVADGYAALQWVAAHAGEIGADAGRLGVMGDGAGGNLAAAVALMARDRKGPELALQVLTYPAVDPACDTPSCKENAEGYLLTLADMHYFWGHYLGPDGDRESPYAAPLRASDLRGLPPALVQTAEFDPLRDEGEVYARRLQQAGVPTTLTRYDGMIHGFVLLSHVLDDGRRGEEEIVRHVRKAFGS